MKTFVFWMVALFSLAGVSAAGWYAYQRNSPAASKGPFRETTVVRGALTRVVNSTGTIHPVTSVQIGAFVSGPIEEIFVDFNSQVKAGQTLAKIDPRLFKAQVARDEASLAHAQADLSRVKAMLEKAESDERRAAGLLAKRGSITQSEVEQTVADRKSWEAQIGVAQASIKQAEASLSLSRANLDYAVIVSPVDGVVTDRKVDPGQTVASQFQTPVLFVVAPEMDKRVHVYAAVDEADVGLIRRAEEEEQPVRFTVDAYPEQMFQGRIEQIRLNPTTLQNVVTYTVVVEAPNVGRMLLPGMTANLSFQISEHKNVLKIPNSALRFFPKAAQVHPDDHHVLERRDQQNAAADQKSLSTPSAVERQTSAVESHRRHVWVAEGTLLRAVEVHTGVSDNQFTELVSGPLKEGRQLVVGAAK